MQLGDFKAVLRDRPEYGLRLILPDGDSIPPEFHVTEVGYVSKKFIDCGGTIRSTESCVLQAWVSDSDRNHRLSAGRLGSILGMARGIVPSDELDVEIEYEGCVISQYSVLEAEAGGSTLTFRLGHKHTDCLAKEACGIESGSCGKGDGNCC